MRKEKRGKRILLVSAVLALVMVMIYSGLQILEATVFYTVPVQQEVKRKTIERNGIEYFPRQDLTTILVMGIDEEGPVEATESYRNSGEADMLALVILDQSGGNYRILCLNRDLMVEMPVLGIGGKEAGSFFGQLALSHTYGSGVEDSAENTRKAVSDFLYGVKIDHYVALNMDAIPVLNDAVGGVTVEVTDDFSRVDSSIRRGTMTLMGEQSLRFVRTRKDVGTELNLSRMGRQQEYMKGLAAALEAGLDSSDTFVAEVYEQLEPYMVTDCSVQVVSGLLQRCADYPMAENLTIPGQNVRGAEFYEFYADEEKTDELILRLFYEEKE